jgi:hypothetical protein
MKNIALILVAICWVCTSSFGQKEEKKENRKACKVELKAYSETNIKPVMQDAYGRLISGLSREDAQFLEQKREEETKLRAELKDQRKTYKSTTKGLDKEARKTKMKEFRDGAKAKRKAFMESMKPFMERNEALIASSMTTMKQKSPEWRAAKKEIREKYMTDEQKEKLAKRKANRQEKADKKDKHPKKGRAAARLLFWDENRMEEE